MALYRRRVHLLSHTLLNALDELSPAELAVILNCLHRCDVKIRGSDYRTLTDRLFEILLRIPKEEAVQHEVSDLAVAARRNMYLKTVLAMQWVVGNVAKTLKLSGDKARKQSVADKYGDLLALFSPTVRMHLFAMLSYGVPARHEAFLEKFLSVVEWKELREKELAKVAFALYTMNYGDKARLRELSSALSAARRWVLLGSIVGHYPCNRLIFIY